MPNVKTPLKPVLEIRNLHRNFGRFQAVRGLDFKIKIGEIVALLGPNGAGKSTTMRMIVGDLAPSAGYVRIGGTDFGKDPLTTRASLGYLPEGAPLYDEMTPVAFLDFLGGCHGLERAKRKQRIEDIVRRLALTTVAEKPIRALSKGFRRRVALGGAMIHDPRLLVLDEPTDGLDPNQKQDVRELLSTLQPERAIVISTHMLEEVAAICTRAIVISRGRAITDTTPAQLQAQGPLETVFRELTASALE